MKIKIQNRFWIIPNALLVNPNITLKAKGLYWYIQSKPDDWDFSAVRIAYETKDGRDGISAGLQELEAFGYLIRNKYKNDKWQWNIEYELLETPHTITENPVWTNEETRPDYPATENPTTEKPATNKTRNTKKEIQNNNNDNICEFDNFWLIYKRKIDKGRAEKSFNRLTTQEKILAVAGAKKWAEKWDAEKTELEYIPHPTTWLNNKRWEIIPPIKKGKSPANAYQDQPDSFLEGFTK
jgi:hypothetical protein